MVATNIRNAILYFGMNQLDKKVLKKGDVICCSNPKCGYKKEPEQSEQTSTEV